MSTATEIIPGIRVCRKSRRRLIGTVLAVGMVRTPAKEVSRGGRDYYIPPATVLKARVEWPDRTRLGGSGYRRSVVSVADLEVVK